MCMARFPLCWCVRPVPLYRLATSLEKTRKSELCCGGCVGGKGELHVSARGPPGAAKRSARLPGLGPPHQGEWAPERGGRRPDAGVGLYTAAGCPTCDLSRPGGSAVRPYGTKVQQRATVTLPT